MPCKHIFEYFTTEPFGWRCNKCGRKRDITYVEQLSQDVHKELEELKKLGVKVNRKALNASLNKEVIKQYSNMNSSEIASLIMEVYNG